MNTSTTRPGSCVRCGRPRRPRELHRCPGPDDPRRELGLTGGAGAALTVLGGVGRPLVVGGSVRDALLRGAGRSVPVVGHGDVDVELHGVEDPDAVADALRRAGAVVTRAGSRFEVLKVVFDGADLDVALVPGTVDETFVRSAARRDFTVDAVAWDPVDNVFLDAFDGIGDAADGVLRHTSDRFADDPLRVLRAVQLVARFGLRVDPETVASARALRDTYGSIAPERVWPELRKLAGGDHLVAALDLLHATGWDAHFPELAAMRDVPQDPGWHPEGAVHVHAGLAAEHAARQCTAEGITGDDRVVIVLAALLHDVGKAGEGTWSEPRPDGGVRVRSLGHEHSGAVAARTLLRRVGAPRHLVDRIVVLVREHMVAHSTNGTAPSVPSARRLLRRLGGSLAAAEAWARVCEADTRGRGTASSSSPAWAWLRVMSSDHVARRRVPLVTGRDLIDAGLVPGPTFRRLLAAAADAQDDGVFDDVAGGRRWLASRLADEERRPAD